MSQLFTPTSVFKFCSILYNSSLIKENEILKHWNERFGEEIKFYHPYFPMKDYYSKEMGESDNLKRFFVLSTKLYDRNSLVSDKLWADELEQDYSKDSSRVVNIDPGYVSLENVVLSTGKNYSHRIHLDQGVFAELTLIFKQPSFVAINWTYPDYSHPQLIDFFNWYRQLLYFKVNSRKA